jgi:hypothetical protein
MSVRRFLAAMVLVALPWAATAEATGPCHCYRERSFDPARPGAADPYILATTRSSLLSAAFGPSKRELVQAVMTGTSLDDLWIAHWAAARTGRTAAALLDAKTKAKVWKAVLGPTAQLGNAVGEALARGASDTELAAVAVDDVLAVRMRTEASVLTALRRAGASTGDVILASVLATRLHTRANTVFEPVRAGKATWGFVLQALGLTPKDIDAVVRQALAA